MPTDLLAARRNDFSQNGEDGIIEAIFAAIEPSNRWCCEFGAWDGLHFSNTRRLIESGWSALLIEADPERHRALVANNAAFGDRVVTAQRMVAVSGPDSIDALLAAAGAPADLDLLIIDVDGPDFEIFEAMTARPRVVCVEINAGHAPESREVIPADVSLDNVGQPLGRFHDVAAGRGYQLVALFGNAFYVERDAATAAGLPDLTPTAAYEQFLAHLTTDERKRLFHVNLGQLPPYHRFHNPRLTRSALGLPATYVGVEERRHKLHVLLGQLRARLSRR